MRKKDELRHPTSCLNKADPNEPIFVLRAKDPIAAQVIRHWAAMAVDIHESEKREEALECAELMDVWNKETISAEPSVVGVSIDNHRLFRGK